MAPSSAISIDRSTSTLEPTAAPTKPVLLDDEYVAKFVRDGFVTIKLDSLSPAFHEGIGKACEVYRADPASKQDRHRSYFSQIPELEQVMTNLRKRLPICRVDSCFNRPFA